MGEEYNLSDSAEMQAGFIVETLKERDYIVQRQHKF
jgi:hypothetical protein